MVLLPGFDGTGRLCIPLIRALSNEADTHVVSYPADIMLGYSELSHEVSHHLPNKPFILVAESFGGPVALQIASKGFSNLRGVVLSAIFVTNPRPVLVFLFDFLIGPKMFQFRPPRWFLRYFVVAKRAGTTLIEAAISAARSVDPDVLAFRLKEIVRVDAVEHMLACPVPVLYLRATEDKLISPKTLETMRSVRPDLEVREVRGPHLLLQAGPAACAEEILQFARKVV